MSSKILLSFLCISMFEYSSCQLQVNCQRRITNRYQECYAPFQVAINDVSIENNEIVRKQRVCQRYDIYIDCLERWEGQIRQFHRCQTSSLVLVTEEAKDQRYFTCGVGALSVGNLSFVLAVFVSFQKLVVNL